jgi:hypothetical protein
LLRVWESLPLPTIPQETAAEFSSINQWGLGFLT